MSDQTETLPKDDSFEEQTPSDLPEDSEYNLPIQLFAGTVIFIMGALVIVTPLVSEMPSDHVLDPVAMNVVSGGIYLAIGAFLTYRGWK